MTKVKIEITGGDKKYMPFKAHDGDAAFDLRACITDETMAEIHLDDGDTIVSSGKTKSFPDSASDGKRKIALPSGATALVSAGFKMEIEAGYEAQIRPRSGNSIKGLTVANSPGTIDSGYRGEVKVILRNSGAGPIIICDGDKIAQMVIQRLPEVELEEVSSVSNDTERGADGFGSTGTVSK